MTHIMNQCIAASYQWCEQVALSSQSSFCWTFRWLDKPQRQAMQALYAFAHITDDLADCEGTIDSKRDQLLVWLNTTRSLRGTSYWECLIDNRSSVACYVPLWPALYDTVTNYRIPITLLEDLILGVLQDVDPQQPRDWDQLEQYCYHVAGSIGIACTRIWQANENLPSQCVIDCGMAFQLTNILRDIATDAKQGRIYLPVTEFEKFDVPKKLWLDGNPTGDWQEMILAIGMRANELYQQGWNTFDHLPNKGQRVFSLMWNYYYQLLQKVVRNPSELWHNPRMRLSKAARLQLIFSHLIPNIRGFSKPTHREATA